METDIRFVLSGRALSFRGEARRRGQGNSRIKPNYRWKSRERERSQSLGETELLDQALPEVRLSLDLTQFELDFVSVMTHRQTHT